ncbi:MAG: DUF4338 domain-containing protein [Thermaerobacter sp.]|nr:DUF4338 domain-containing protein [Thermaerobacter sp.]
MRVPVDQPFWIGDRCFTPDDLAHIRETVHRCRKFSRAEIAATLCENLPWKAPNGQLKMAACRELLEDLAEQGLITLPTKRSRSGSTLRPQEWEGPVVPTLSLTSPLADVRPVTIDPVLAPERRAWNATMQAFHPLGYRRPIGAHQRYWIRLKVGEQRAIVGALLFGAAAKALAARDEWIGWTPAERARFRWRIVNNNRFLLLPGIAVPHLASHVLALATKRLPDDWKSRYGYAPVLLETFVEPPWTGTSYRAANWQYLGDTAGRGRQDREHASALSVKMLWVYPLTPDWRAQLCKPAPQPPQEVEEDDEEFEIPPVAEPAKTRWIKTSRS